MRSLRALVLAGTLLATAALPAAASAADPCPAIAGVPDSRLAPVVAAPAPAKVVTRGAPFTLRVTVPLGLQEDYGYTATPRSAETVLSRNGVVVQRWAQPYPADVTAQIALLREGRYSVASTVEWDLTGIPVADPAAPPPASCTLTSESTFRVVRRMISRDALVARLNRGLNRTAGGVRRGSLGLAATHLGALAMEMEGVKLRRQASTRALDRWIPVARTFAVVMAEISAKQPAITPADAKRLDRAASRFQAASKRLAAGLGLG